MRSLIARLLFAAALLFPASAGALTRNIHATFWTANNGLIPVCFADGMRTLPDVKRRIISALKNSWQKYLDVIFTEFDTCNSDFHQQRVRVLVKELPTARWGAQTRGVGIAALRAGPMPECDSTGSEEGAEKCRWSMSLVVPRDRFRNRPLGVWTAGAERTLRYEVVHEFGHVLGFQHEQDSAKNWRFMRRRTPAGFDLSVPYEEIYCRPAVNTNYMDYQAVTNADFDVESIMVQGYCSGGHRSKDKGQWIPGAVPRNGILSPTDIDAAQAIYGKPVNRVRQRVP